MCECINEVDKVIKEKYKDPLASLDTIWNLADGSFYPRLSATYRKQKKNGDFNIGNTSLTISPTYCPFCGVKYEEKKKENPE